MKKTASRTLLSAALASLALSANSAAAEPSTSHPRLYLTPTLVGQIKTRAAASNPVYQSGIRVVAENFKAKMDSGELYQIDDGNPWQGIATGYDVATGAEVLAFHSLIDPSPSRRADFGQRARDLAMYVIDHVLEPDPDKWFQDPIFSTNYRGNFHGEAIPLAVDWAYPYFSAEDKAKIAHVFMRWIGQNLTATTSGLDHPAPVGVTEDPALFSSKERLRTALNNFSASHMRNITLMSLALDPEDEVSPADYAAENKLATMGVPGYATLRDHIKDATGAWLYTVYEALGRYAVGGVPVEGFEYNGVSTARMAETLLALHTAGYDDADLYGPQVSPENSPFWDEVIPSFFHLVSPSPAPLAEFAWLGPLYQPANYGDIEKDYSPDFMNLFGPLGTYDLLTGNTARLAQIRWIEKFMAPGGAAKLAARAADSTSPRAGLFYFVLFDPTLADPPDPRPSQPLFATATGMGSIQSRTGWNSTSTWLSYMLPWNDLDHQHGTGNMIQLWRKGEWITKERSGYGYDAGLSTYKNTLAIQNDPPGSDLDFLQLAVQHGTQPAYVGAGDPTLIAYSDRSDYTYVTGDATNLYNADLHYTSHDVHEARRSVFWMKSDVVVVMDRAITGKSGRFKQFWMNFTAAPTLVGTRAKVTTPGGQSVALDTLLPLNAGAKIDNSKPLYDPLNPSTDETAAGETAKFRVHIDAPGNPADATFLHVLQARDTSAQIVTPVLVKSDAGAEFTGARVGDSVVMFAASIRTKPTSTGYHVPITVLKHFVTGLDPALKYAVALSSAASKWAVVVTASPEGTFLPDAGGVLAFKIQSGVATPRNDSATAWFTDVDLGTIGTPDPIEINGESGDGEGDPAVNVPAVPVVSTKLASLSVAGLSPVFEPDVDSYTVAVPDGECSVPVTVIPEDPNLTVMIQSTVVPAGQAYNVWLCDGTTQAAINLYSGWTKVGTTTLTRVTAPVPDGAAQIPNSPVPTATATATPPAQTPLASLVVPGLTPAFDPAILSYTAPKPGSGSLSVTATLGDPSLSLFIDCNPAPSGQAVSTWVGASGKVNVVVYSGWSQVAHYTITAQ
ncbi:MAG: cadherin-like beta sandwich domain-containing protein [Polyangiaceae bacterium]